MANEIRSGQGLARQYCVLTVVVDGYALNVAPCVLWFVLVAMPHAHVALSHLRLAFVHPQQHVHAYRVHSQVSPMQIVVQRHDQRDRRTIVGGSPIPIVGE